MRHGSLFSGIGGFELAAEWMGWENVFHCENNPIPRRVLQYYWPKAKSYEDIKETDFSVWRGRVDIITGGFPCQPFSTAGERRGTEDDRYLWPEMCRAIREARPRWVVAENVHGIITWDEGLVVKTIISEMEAEGYEVGLYVLPAAGVEAPHGRDRTFFIATDPKLHGLRTDAGAFGLEHERGGDARSFTPPPGERRTFADSHVEGLQERIQIGGRRIGKTQEQIRRRQLARAYSENRWGEFPTVSPFSNGDDGVSGRLDGISFSAWRRETIKAAGNAVVPQLVYQIFKTIEHLKQK